MSTCIAKSLDHIVITCRNLAATRAFYTKVLGMEHESFVSSASPKVERHALRFGNQKINLHELGKEFEPKAAHVQTGSADLCFITDTPITEVLKRLKATNQEVLEGGQVVERTGAVGKLLSVYVRDPDLNLIEISNYQ